MSKKRISSNEIIKNIANDLNLPATVVREVLLAFQKVVIESGENLKEGEVVQVPYPVRGLGFFEWKITRPRKARNPKTGESVNVPARPKLSFKRTKSIS